MKPNIVDIIVRNMGIIFIFHAFVYARIGESSGYFRRMALYSFKI